MEKRWFILLSCLPNFFWNIYLYAHKQYYDQRGLSHTNSSLVSIPPQHAHRQLDDTARDGFAEVEIDSQPLQDHRQVEEQARDGFAEVDIEAVTTRHVDIEARHDEALPSSTRPSSPRNLEAGRKCSLRPRRAGGCRGQSSSQ